MKLTDVKNLKNSVFRKTMFNTEFVPKMSGN